MFVGLSFQSGELKPFFSLEKSVMMDVYFKKSSSTSLVRSVLL